MIRLAVQMWLSWAQPVEPPLAFDVYESRAGETRTLLPTVVLLHGRNDALHGLPRALRNSKLPLRLVVPWGPRILRDGSHAWFRPGQVRKQSTVAGDIEDAARQVVELLSALQTTGVVQGRPVLVGYSQGATVALEVALRNPELVGEVVAISGHLPPAHVPVALKGHAVTHVLIGEEDRVMSAKICLEQVTRMRELGYLVEAVRFPKQGHGMSLEMRRVALRRIFSALRSQASVHAESDSAQLITVDP